jgi:hypothetical protein
MHLVIKRRRTSKRTARSLSKQLILTKKTKMVVALFAGAKSIGQVRD